MYHFRSTGWPVEVLACWLDQSAKPLVTWIPGFFEDSKINQNKYQIKYSTITHHIKSTLEIPLYILVGVNLPEQLTKYYRHYFIYFDGIIFIYNII